ncbi:MAG TPA: HlyD family efflux transporter periplasmic adaptor subunit [Burkholderiales bacterium]|nr:HlyD family efflux transporter periplasmic adaptor subunit [Burkholderiales bacterium]
MRTAFAALACGLLAACSQPANDGYQGYMEGEFVLLASPNAGQLQKLLVKRGERIESGKPVFVLEQENERAARLEAEQRVKTAQARVENLQGAHRVPEVEAAKAQAAQARAARELAASQLAQQEKLFKSGFISQARLDEARSAYARDAARVAETDAQVRNLRLPLGRAAELEGAETEVGAARAALAQAEWRLAQKSVVAPAAGTVQDTFFVEGEWVPAGRPVASILPPGNVKARFYVPESALGALKVGQAVQISCDGCGAPVRATLSYVSTQAEYAPPFLYSKESRAKLVFLAEARPEAASALRPGQPVDVKLAK